MDFNHRQEVIQFLQSAAYSLQAAQNLISNFAGHAVFADSVDTEDVKNTIIEALSTCADIQRKNVDVVSALCKPEIEVLDEVRRVLSAPQFNDGSSLFAWSRLMLMIGKMFRFEVVEPLPGGASIPQASGYVSAGWLDTNIATGHLQSAIRKEVYNDSPSRNCVEEIEKGHHREHAIEFLESANARVKQAQGHLTLFADNVVFVEGVDRDVMKFRLDLAISYCNAIPKINGDAITKLHNPDSEVLDEVRALLNGPSVREKSSVQQFTQLFSNIHLIFRHEVLEPNPGFGQPSQASSAANFGWHDVELAIWHVFDATREEVYNDPAFF